MPKKHSSLFCPTVNDEKSFETVTPGANVIKLSLSVINEFSYQARVFVRLGRKSLEGTNTTANYEKS